MLWRRALRGADLITAAGPGLVELMARGSSQAATAVVPMAADPTGFEPRDKEACRRQLDLPLEQPLVGYCGSMHRSRGVTVLFDALPMITRARPEVGFIHSGRTWKNVPIPDDIRSLGYIDDDQVPALLNSMDVLVVVNKDSAFGHYSHPVKLYEALSCGVPVVATRTQATEWILAKQPERLFDAGDPAALTRAVLASLDNPHADFGNVPTWESSCDSFERSLESPTRVVAPADSDSPRRGRSVCGTVDVCLIHCVAEPFLKSLDVGCIDAGVAPADVLDGNIRKCHRLLVGLRPGEN